MHFLHGGSIPLGSLACCTFYYADETSRLLTDTTKKIDTQRFMRRNVTSCHHFLSTVPVRVHPKTRIEIGSFDEQRLFSVKSPRFRNFFDFAQDWGILESDKL